MVTRLDSTRIHLVAAAMAKAFQQEPNFAFVIPDAARRARVLPWVFERSVAALASRHGEAYSSESSDGGAFWIAPGQHVGFWAAARAGLLEVPFRMGLGGARRFATLGGHVEELRKRHILDPHWYLMALGVDPARQGTGIGGALLQPVLGRADAEGIPCYLETFAERNLPFYKRFGFRICAQSKLPDGPDLWAMFRRPERERYSVPASP